MKDGQTKIEDEGFVSAEKSYVPLSDARLREIALGCRAGTVFGTWMMRESDMHLIHSIFMPLLFLNDIHHKELQRENITHFYGEDKDRIGGSINGLPMFGAVSYLSADDCKRLGDVQRALAAFMDGTEPENA